MPPLPWKTIRQPDPDATLVVMATHLPLTRHRSIPRFLRQTMQIRRQLAQAEGLVGYSLDAKLWKRQFRTLSVWESRHALQRFARAEPHAGITRHRPERMGASRFVMWDVAGREVPIAWADAAARLEDG